MIRQNRKYILDLFHENKSRNVNMFLISILWNIFNILFVTRFVIWNNASFFCLKIISNGTQIESPHIFSMRRLKLLCT